MFNTIVYHLPSAVPFSVLFTVHCVLLVDCHSTTPLLRSQCRWRVQRQLRPSTLWCRWRRVSLSRRRSVGLTPSDPARLRSLRAWCVFDDSIQCWFPLLPLVVVVVMMMMMMMMIMIMIMMMSVSVIV